MRKTTFYLISFSFMNQVVPGFKEYDKENEPAPDQVKKLAEGVQFCSGTNSSSETYYRSQVEV